jgi:hypothetical protein
MLTVAAVIYIFIQIECRAGLIPFVPLDDLVGKSKLVVAGNVLDVTPVG